jgi:signal transduction histidine kinase
MSQFKSSDKTVLKYTLFGVSFGLLFPVFALLLDCCFFNDGNFSLASMTERIASNPIHYIIFSAPIFLGLAFFIAGRLASRQKQLNQKLNKVINELRISNDSLDSFNYHVSHDLKTVVNNTQALTKMATKYNDKENNEKVAEVLKRLQKVATNGKETVESFLELSSAEQYLKEKDSEPIEIETETRRLLDEHNISEQVTITFMAQDFNSIQMHPKAFESVMMNLITNSIKYCDSDPAINITMVSNDEHNIIVYNDNGIGMDLSKDKTKLFQPFVRLKNDKKAPGTGVGLYLVDKIVNSHSGRIEVDSELGKGTKFKLFFPRN